MYWITKKIIGISMVVLRPFFVVADIITGFFVPGYYKERKNKYWNVVYELL